MSPRALLSTPEQYFYTTELFKSGIRNTCCLNQNSKVSKNRILQGFHIQNFFISYWLFIGWSSLCLMYSYQSLWYSFLYRFGRLKDCKLWIQWLSISHLKWVKLKDYLVNSIKLEVCLYLCCLKLKVKDIFYSKSKCIAFESSL